MAWKYCKNCEESFEGRGQNCAECRRFVKVLKSRSFDFLTGKVFYVYEWHDEDGLFYIGRGRRLRAIQFDSRNPDVTRRQRAAMKHRTLEVKIVAEFDFEAECICFETQRIQEFQPSCNQDFSDR